MPDHRKHRGPHPDDVALFARDQWPILRRAVAEMAWLLTRGYSPVAALKLVGDQYRLNQRQRLAVMRSTCSDQSLADRTRRRLSWDQCASGELWLDGFNILTTVEAALSGGILLRGRDGCYRDMASMHGSYRKVMETQPAIERIGRALAAVAPVRVVWWLDRPVSNSGRLKQVILEAAQLHQWPWDVQLVNSPDQVLKQQTVTIVSADSAILDACGPWLNLAAAVVERFVGDACVVPLDELGE